MSKLPPVGSPERDFVVERLMNDTGFYCRYVLGMDTDRDEHGNCLIDGQEGKGGIRAEGPHQETIAFLDDKAHTHRLLWAPRAAYKSSMIRGYVQRLIIAHPNISILLYMQDEEMAQRRFLGIKEDLENNEILRELFPNMVGPSWTRKSLITGLRTDKVADTPTFFIGTPRTIPVGMRPNEIIWDDIVTENDLGEAALERGRRCVERSLPLGAKGCRYTFVGTPKHYGDAGHMIVAMPKWKKLIHLDVGFEIKVRDDKSMYLTGKGRWPHLDKARIEPLLAGGVKFPTFMSEYMLKVVSGTFQRFHRHHFQTVPWREEFQDLTGYLLTDIAQGTPEGATSSEKGRGALNVLFYVGIDARERVYILDCEAGRWPMLEYCERYLNMRARWSSRVNHRAELMEQVNSNTGYASFLGIKGKERGIPPLICWQKRSGSDVSKDSRINTLSLRFQAHEVFVVDTMPRIWVDDTDVKQLWDPEGYVDVPTGNKYPAGELVEQFVRYPNHPLKDIPDALALVDSIDTETKRRVCFHVKPSRLRLAESEMRQQAQKVGTQSGASTRFYERIRKRR